MLSRASRKLSRMKLIDVAQLHTVQETVHLSRLFDYLNIDLVLDIGANSGQYAERLRRLVGYKGTIVSAEPIPDMVRELESRSTGDPNWHVEPIAVTSVMGDVSFNVMNDKECSSLLSPSLSETTLYEKQTTISENITVPGVTLDHLLERWVGDDMNRSVFVKLDTQGHDLEIIKSCSRLTRVSAFQSELSVRRLYENAPDFRASLDHYLSRDFVISAMVPNNAAGFPQTIEIDCVMVRADLVE